MPDSQRFTADASTPGVAETPEALIQRLLRETREAINWTALPDKRFPDMTYIFHQAELEESMAKAKIGDELFILITPNGISRYQQASMHGEKNAEIFRREHGLPRILVRKTLESTDPFIREHGGSVFQIQRGEDVETLERDERGVTQVKISPTWHIVINGLMQPFKHMHAVERWGTPNKSRITLDEANTSS